MNCQPRRLSPSELARQDQYEAAATDIGRRDPTTAVITTVIATPGRHCCWCDCAIEAHQRPGYTCAGCPDQAYYTVKVFDGTARASHFSVCAGHHQDFRRALAAQMRAQFGPIPVDTLAVDVLDEHQAGS